MRATHSILFRVTYGEIRIEVALVGGEELADLAAAIALANSEQIEFLFSTASDDLAKRLQMLPFEHNKVSEFFDQMCSQCHTASTQRALGL